MSYQAFVRFLPVKREDMPLDERAGYVPVERQWMSSPLRFETSSEAYHQAEDERRKQGVYNETEQEIRRSADDINASFKKRDERQFGTFGTVEPSPFSTVTSDGKRYRVFSGWYFYPGTSELVIRCLVACHEKRVRVYIWYGDTATGEAWSGQCKNGASEVCYIERTGGEIKTPIAVYNARSSGGTIILTDRIIKIQATDSKYPLYKHSKFHPTSQKNPRGNPGDLVPQKPELARITPGGVYLLESRNKRNTDFATNDYVNDAGMLSSERALNDPYYGFSGSWLLLGMDTAKGYLVWKDIKSRLDSGTRQITGIVHDLDHNTHRVRGGNYTYTIFPKGKTAPSRKEGELYDTAAVESVKRVLETGNINELNKEAYDFINQHMGFIAHYSLLGFRDAYDGRIREFAHNLLASEMTDNEDYNLRYAERIKTDDSYGVTYGRKKAATMRAIVALATIFLHGQPKRRLRG